MMDEYSDSGFDPEVRRYFKKILNTIGIGLFWVMLLGVAGFYFRLAIIGDAIRWQNIAFYVFFLVTLVWVILHFYKVWKHR